MSNYGTREQKEWWTYTEDSGVKRATGYRCTPMNPDMWWFPEIGSSIHEDNVFRDECAALSMAIKKTQQRIDSLTRIQSGYETRLCQTQ